MELATANLLNISKLRPIIQAKSHLSNLNLGIPVRVTELQNLYTVYIFIVIKIIQVTIKNE